MWGFATDADNDLGTDGGETPSSPGPRLTVPVGDTTVNIHVRNDLAQPISVVIPGLVGAGDPTWTDGTSGPRSATTQRVRSLTHETAPGAIGAYSWTGMRPGTLLYLSGTHQSVQVQMGLFGGITQDSAAGEAYPGISYAKEACSSTARSTRACTPRSPPARTARRLHEHLPVRARLLPRQRRAVSQRHPDHLRSRGQRPGPRPLPQRRAQDPHPGDARLVPQRRRRGRSQVRVRQGAVLGPAAGRQDLRRGLRRVVRRGPTRSSTGPWT